jgi:glutamine---fructose-6-phosphate transaminase (isomerizing)
MRRTPLQEQIDSLPRLVSEMIGLLATEVGKALPDSLCEGIRRVFVTGCGDSHHAALNSELAFEQLGRAALRTDDGDAVRPLCGAIFAARRTRGQSAAGDFGERAGEPDGGGVGPGAARRGRGGRHHRQPGRGVGAGGGGGVANGRFLPPHHPTRPGCAGRAQLHRLAVGPLPDGHPPGRKAGHLSRKEAEAERRGLGETAVFQAQTIARCDPIAQQLAHDWRDADPFVFCGAGPNYGAALFSAAKLIEASGDTAIGQDTEEWAHLQYFGKEPDTPTFIISAGGWDASRAAEVVRAAQQIGRRVALIAPESSDLAQAVDPAHLLPISGTTPEHFSPLLTCLPGLLFAAHRAELLNEPYFRAFSGGRSSEGGGGISRIQTSERIG